MVNYAYPNATKAGDKSFSKSPLPVFDDGCAESGPSYWHPCGKAYIGTERFGVSIDPSRQTIVIEK